MIIITDICPVDVRDRVRGSIWISGWLCPVPAADIAEDLLAFAEARPAGCLLGVGRTARLLELHMYDVILSDRAGTGDVPIGEYLAAAPDPLTADEAMALQHLDVAHRDLLAGLVSGLPEPPADARAVHPVALDSRGLTLRVGGPGATSCDVRFAFDPPLRDVAQLAEAVCGLLD